MNDPNETISRYGTAIAKKPWIFILLCLVITGLSGIGLINYYEETNPFKLWIPSGSDFVENNAWLEENFPPDARYNNIIISGEDILDPEVIREVRS